MGSCGRIVNYLMKMTTVYTSEILYDRKIKRINTS